MPTGAGGGEALARSVLRDEPVSVEMDAIIAAPWIAFWQQADTALLGLASSAPQGGPRQGPDGGGVVPAAEVDALRHRLGALFRATLDSSRQQVEDFRAQLGQSLVREQLVPAPPSQRVRELEAQVAGLLQQRDEHLCKIRSFERRWDDLRRKVEERQASEASAGGRSRSVSGAAAAAAPSAHE
eukprot:TRINITY_DN51768_c0_g1_i1.p3 TRINITY_DN51768_c0_g1~~TRINITY_DN51768_c0_g1_i1.p3  ORF type:complete len:184 (+),score=61.39 TRINITY_DN51768_c0_g1_i1:539-1090(+)